MVCIKITSIIILFPFLINAQVTNESSKVNGYSTYIDSNYCFSFNYPSYFSLAQNHNRFTIRHNSDFYLFGRVVNIKKIINDDFYDTKAFKNSKDLFKEVAIQATLTTKGLEGDNGEAHFRADSLNEFYSAHGLRVIAVYFTIVTYVYNTGAYEEEYADPVFWVDISSHSRDSALRLEFRDYQKEVMKNLSKTVFSSLKLIKK